MKYIVILLYILCKKATNDITSSQKFIESNGQWACHEGVSFILYVGSCVKELHLILLLLSLLTAISSVNILYIGLFVTYAAWDEQSQTFIVWTKSFAITIVAASATSTAAAATPVRTATVAWSIVIMCTLHDFCLEKYNNNNNYY